MTEAEWQAGTDPWPMLEFLERRGSERKLLLFAAACCRRAWSLSADPRHHAAIEAAERHAAGELDAPGFAAALQPVVELWGETGGPDWTPERYMTAATRHLEDGGNAKYAARFVAHGLADRAGPEDGPAWHADRRAEEAAQAAILRDLVGDPSRPFAFDPAWLAGAGREAAELARAVDRAGGADDLAPLAEALERAGCGDRAVLDHCRRPGPHARGCWVVDALLGREPAVRPGLLTEADWRDCPDPTSLLAFLRDKGSERQWRLFALACCRRIDRWIVDPRSRRALDVAARHTAGHATDAELADARAAAQAAQEEAKRAEWSTEAQENFQVTPRYAAVSRDLFAARAARGTVNRDPRTTDDDLVSRRAKWWGPSHHWAVATARWAIHADPPDPSGAAVADPAGFPFVMTEHGKLTSGPLDPHVEAAADAAGAAELRIQAAILFDIFGAVLGPPGEDGGWLPAGTAAPTAEWWCRLPTPRRVDIRPDWRQPGGTVARLAREIDEQGAYGRLPLLADALHAAGCTDPALLGHLRSDGPHGPGCWAVDLLLGRDEPPRQSLRAGPRRFSLAGSGRAGRIDGIPPRELNRCPA